MKKKTKLVTNKRQSSQQNDVVTKTKKKRKKDKVTATVKEEPISSLCNVIIDPTEDDRNTNLDDLFASTLVSSSSTTAAIPMTTQSKAMPNQNLNDIDDCLELMDQSFNHQLDTAIHVDDSIVADNSTNSTKNVKKEKSNSLLSSSTSTTTTNGNRSSNENQTNLWKNNGTQSQPELQDFYLPNIQVELSRHKLMGELSTFLLSKCTNLRMPSFERWVLDSKIEKRIKRQSVQKINELKMTANTHNDMGRHTTKEMKWLDRMKRKGITNKSLSLITQPLEQHLTSSGMKPIIDYDNVIPTMVDKEDKSTQYLMNEIEVSLKQPNRNKKKKKNEIIGDDNIKAFAEKVCRELCQKSCNAGKQLQNLNQHLGGPVHVNTYLQKGSKKTASSAASSIGRILLEVDDIDKSQLHSTSKSTKTNTNTIYKLVYSRKLKSSEQHKNKKEGSKQMKPFVVKINVQHYEKLKEMYNYMHHEHLHVSSAKPIPSTRDSIVKYSPSTNIFHHLVFCALIRYAALSGGQQLLDLRGGGMQGAINNQVFDCLSKLSSSNESDNHASNHSIMECFASPFNVYNQRYCSIFSHDLDNHFCSCGDFFNVPIGYFMNVGPIHEANPPFSPGLMNYMVKRMEEHLSFADSTADQFAHDKEKGRLTFVIVIPTCKSKSIDSDNVVQDFASDSFQKMMKSPYFVKHIILKPREHGYVEGAQHLKPTRHKESQYSTSIVILQSRNSRESENVTPVVTNHIFESEIRTAFASRHQLELSERRSSHE